MFDIFRAIIVPNFDLSISTPDVIEEMKLSNSIIKISENDINQDINKRIAQCQERKMTGNSRYAADAYSPRGHAVLEKVRESSIRLSDARRRKCGDKNKYDTALDSIESLSVIEREM